MRNEAHSIPLSFRYNLINRSTEENKRVADILIKLKKEKKLSHELNKCIDNYYFKTDDTLTAIKTQSIDEKLQLMLHIFAATKEKGEKELLVNMFTLYYKNDVAMVDNTSLQSNVAPQETSEPIQISAEKLVEKIVLTNPLPVKEAQASSVQPETKAQVSSVQPETKATAHEDEDEDEFAQLPNPYAKQK